jgi:hypothetical protein
MHVLVNGVRLFFDVEGAKLMPDGPAMREKPTLLLLHGGPGFDHSIYRPASRPWLMSLKSSISIIAATVAARMVPDARHRGDPGLRRAQMSQAAKTRPAPEGAGEKLFRKERV